MCPDFKTSEVMNSLYKLLALEKRYCAPYYPAGNGEAERKNKVLLHMLQKLVDEFPRWKSMLGILQMAVNSAVNRSTGYSAFKLMTGREMMGIRSRTYVLMSETLSIIKVRVTWLIRHRKT